MNSMKEPIREDALYSSYLSSEESKKRIYDYEVSKIKGIDEAANYNFLTHLPVLRLFNVLSSDIILQNADLKFAVIMMDISEFKAVNEFLGRDEGDRLLCYIGDVLKEIQDRRRFTVAGHARADLFLLFTTFEDRQELADICLEIKRRISDMHFAYKVIMSFGICASEDRQPSVSYLRDCAGIALKKVKGKYFTDFNFFEDEMRTLMLTEKLMESELLLALENHEIVPYIQPKVDMVTGRIVGGEALTRWIHPKHGVVGPSEFIPITEKNGLIISIDRFMWDQVFKYQRQVISEGRKPLPISVNVSRMHVHDRDLAETIIKLQDENDVPPYLVPLELTESAFTPEEKEMNRRMTDMRRHGFLISMDDFGSGYSSLNMLKTSEMDEIKLDRIFLSDMASAKCRTVVSHMLGLLSALDVSVIVEGVENEMQRDFLVRNGCAQAQGFLYYKPMPLQEFDLLIRKQELARC